MKILSIVLIFVLLTVIWWQVNSNPKAQTGQPDHYHAGLIVYVDGVKKDFSDSKYMQTEVCNLNVHENDNPISKAHLHNNIGDVAHIHVAGTTWRTLFSNLGLNFANLPSVSGYRESKRIDNILDEPILENDSVIVIVGNETGIDLNQYVSKQRIAQVSALQESVCGDH